jgi:flagellar FliL protein
MERPNEASTETAAPNADAVEGEAEGILDRLFWPILLSTVGLALVLGVGLAYVQYGWLAEKAAALPVVGEALAASPDSPETRAPGEYGSFTKMEGLIVNPAGSSGMRYLALSLAFESGSSSVVQEIENKKVVVRDAVLKFLSEHTAEQLSNPTRRTALKDSLRAETNRLLTTGTVDRLYFTQFVLQ